MGGIESFVRRHDYRGRMLGGVYRLESVLGQGGFGEVWRATVQTSGAPVAVKVLPPGMGRSPQTIATLQHECKMLKALTHPNICRVLDFIVDDQLGAALVMELVEGKDIYKATASVDCEPYFVQLLQALSYLHGKKVLHLDIKPGNCLVMNGQVKLIDFGLATILPPGKKMGTPSYMAPEMLLDETRKDIDGRADLFSVAVLWYYCLTRENPFYSINPKDGEDKKLHGEHPPPPSQKLPKGVRIPDYTDRIVMKLIARRPSERFASANRVLKDLEVATGKTIPMSGDIASAFAEACGEFIGRRDILAKLSGWMSNAAKAPTVSWLAVNGERGVGKTRLLHECKFIAQLGHCQTIDLDSADKITPEILAPLADALAAPRNPTVVLLDNYDRWMNDADATPLQNLLDALRQHPHPPTRIYCIMTAGRDKTISSKMENMRLQPLSQEEVGEFLDAVASPPPAHRQSLATQLMKLTGGNSALLTRVVTEIVTRGQMASQSGKWVASLFEDISIDIPEFSLGRPPQVALSPNSLLARCRSDRQAGHALRALEFILHCPNLTEELLIEAAECAISCGKYEDAIALIQTWIANFSSEHSEREGEAPVALPLEGATRAPEKDANALLLWRLGVLQMLNNDNDAAHKSLMAAKDAVKDENSPLAVSIHNQLARYDLVAEHYDEAVAKFRKWRDAGTDEVLNNELGYALVLTEKPEEAISVLNDDIQKFRRLGHVRKLLEYQQWRGDALVALNRLDEAVSEYENIVEVARNHQELRIMAAAYEGLAGAWVRNKDVKKGIGFYEKSQALYYYLGQMPGAAVVINNMGGCHMQLEQLKEAQYEFETALAFLDKAPLAWQRNKVQSFLGLAEIDRQEKRFNAALKKLDEAETLANQHHVIAQYRFPLILTRAEIARDRGDIPVAHKFMLDAKPFALNPMEKKAWEDVERSL